MKTRRFSMLLLFTLFASASVFGQDIIVKRDGGEIEANVVEVTDTHIRYYRYAIPAGPIYNIARDEIVMIEYANGERDIFTAPYGSQAAALVEGRMTVNVRGFFIGEERVSYAQAMTYAEPYPEVAKHLRTGRGLVTGSYVMAGAGGFMLGYGLAKMFGRRKDLSSDSMRSDIKATYGFWIGGSAVIGGAFGLAAIGTGQYRKAARIYNSAAFAGVRRYDLTLSPAVTPGGLGLQLTF